jgi:hypothetical protein
MASMHNMQILLTPGSPTSVTAAEDRLRISTAFYGKLQNIWEKESESKIWQLPFEKRAVKPLGSTYFLISSQDPWMKLSPDDHLPHDPDGNRLGQFLPINY